jgi:hypothetical protein
VDVTRGLVNRGRRVLTRHRRPVAAALAAAAVLLTVSTLRADPPPPTVTEQAPLVAAGEVTVPVPIALRSVVDLLQPGDVVDLVAVTPEGGTDVVVERVRVVDAPSGGLSSAGGVLLVAVPESDAVALAGAGAQGSLSVLIRPRGTAPPAPSTDSR